MIYIENKSSLMNAREALPESRQAGVTLVEIVMVLAVIAVIILSAAGLFGQAFGTSKTRTETSNIQGLISGVQNVYGTTRDYPAGDMTPTMVSLKAAPAGIISAGTLRNSWGGAISVTGSGSAYSISDSGIPKRACVELAQLPVEPQSVTVNGSAAPQIPMTVTQATSLCTQETGNTIVWQLR